MANNLFLSVKTQTDIDARVERVLKGLGNPEPPLRLEDVRELLKLDLSFYSADDPGVLREAISRVRVAAIQVFQRPTLIIDAIRKFSLTALYLPDRKRILLDQATPTLKHRWNEAHEIGHSLIPWHQEMMHGDNHQTLSAGCHEQVEAEANFAAGRMLFLRDRFVSEVRSVAPNIQSVKALKNTYGNTLSTTLYRFIESVDSQTPVVGMISCHPHIIRRPNDFDEHNPSKHFIRSLAFDHRFSKLTQVNVFDRVTRYCGA